MVFHGPQKIIVYRPSPPPGRKAYNPKSFAALDFGHLVKADVAQALVPAAMALLPSRERSSPKAPGTHDPEFGRERRKAIDRLNAFGKITVSRSGVSAILRDQARP